MEKTLKKSVVTLKRLNNYVDKEVVDDVVIQEEYENVEDFKKLQENIDQHVKAFGDINPYNIEEVKKNLLICIFSLWIIIGIWIKPKC